MTRVLLPQIICFSDTKVPVLVVIECKRASVSHVYGLIFLLRTSRSTEYSCTEVVISCNIYVLSLVTCHILVWFGGTVLQSGPRYATCPKNVKQVLATFHYNNNNNKQEFDTAPNVGAFRRFTSTKQENMNKK